MMYWLTVSGAVAALAGLGLAWHSRRRLIRAEAALARTRAQLQSTNDQLKFRAAEADELLDEVRRLQARLDHIALEDRRVRAGSEKADILTAITLTRKGADTASLTGSCGLSRGEAQLVGVLYGRMATSCRDGTAH